ncbi:type IV secretion system protein [Gymnodinialimonas sp. 2305UL16-5]|uniref:type IV secretion system protein n=1 Tax=Gymnodinialimonas mytili TaxID=3126503 RepID=UPI0030B6D588
MPNYTHRIAALVTATTLCVTSPAMAQGVPTIDSRSLLQQIQILEQMLQDMGIQNQQLTQIIEQVNLLQQQIAQLEQIQSLLEDPESIVAMLMGDELDGLLQGNFDLSMVETIVSGVNGDWSGIAEGVSGEFEASVNRVLEGAGTSPEGIAALAESPNPIARLNATATTTGAATSAAAEVAYQEAQQSVQRVQVLVEDISNMRSLRAALDHNTRVTAELAIAMASMWQLESVQTMGTGMGGVLDAATFAEIQRFSDLTPPDY